jgi:hypothetical protein
MSDSFSSVMSTQRDSVLENFGFIRVDFASFRAFLFDVEYTLRYSDNPNPYALWHSPGMIAEVSAKDNRESE